MSRSRTLNPSPFAAPLDWNRTEDLSERDTSGSAGTSRPHRRSPNRRRRPLGKVSLFFFLVSQFDNDKISGKASPYFYKVVGAPGGLLHVEAVEELVDGVESRLGVHLPGALSRVRVLAVGTGGRGSYVACCKHYFCLNSKNIQV